MGRNYRFRLSDMIPNSWFYKLRDMGTTRNRLNTTSNPANKFRHLPSSSFSSSTSSSSSSSKLQPHHRKSYHFTRPDLTFHPNSPIKSTTDPPPRKSSSRRRRSLKRYRPQPTRRQVSTTIAAACSCRTSLESVWNKPPDSTPEEYANSPDQTTSSSDHDSVMPECGSDDDDDVVSRSTPCKCKPQNDIVIEMDKELPPIITKKHIEPTKIQRTSAEFSESNAYGSLRVKVVKEDFVNWTGKDEPVKTGKRFPVNSSSSPGVRLRTNSPRILNRRARKSTSSSSNSSVSESFAVVKSSKNPRRDFRESMVEMIVQNNIRASQDLEELLACYLSLNSDEYHDMIINVFKQIWFDFIVHVQPKGNN